jgi:hypothetical protein
MIAALSFVAASSRAEMSQPELQALFERSRSAASQAVAATQDCQIQASELSTTMKSWLMNVNNRQALAQDIVTSVHSWSWGNYQMCATTLNSPRSPVEFSYKACLTALRQSEDASRILIETGLYHLGLTNAAEIFAVAWFLNSSKLQCYPPGSPFDPSICPAQTMTERDLLSYLGPAENYKAVGQHKLYLRSRFCNKLTGCLPWVAAELKQFYAYKAFDGTKWRPASEIESRLGIYISGSNSNYHAKATHSEILDAAGSTTLNKLLWADANSKEYQVEISRRTAGIYRTCSWIQFFGTSNVSTSGAYYDLEAVYYGTH